MTELERLGRHVAEEQDALRASQGAARAALRERIAQQKAPRVLPGGLRPWYLASAGGVLAAAAAVLMFVTASKPAALRVQLGATAQPVLAGAWLESTPGVAPLALRFSDGTHVELASGTRARLIEVDAHGAHLMLENGSAHVSVRHRPGTEYRLSMGPFAVRVIGTRFDVRWDPERDDFGIDLREGRVELSGCVFERGYALRAGQSVSASCRGGRFEIENTRPTHEAKVEAEAPARAEATETTARAEVKTQGAPGDAQEAAAPAPVAARARAAPDWRALARRGEYAAAYGIARDAGFAAECARADAEDLALLAEAARYAGQRGDEADALLLLRRRFAGTSRAALAAFGLGRLEFDERHAYAKAARWFDTYLKERPEGSLAREARGRLLEATLSAGDRRAARKLASEYLREHPQGPHGALARRVLEPPEAKRFGGKPAPVL
jgi:hypothetical protein